MTDRDLKEMRQYEVKNHYNGTLCPKAHLRRAITIEQAINAPMVAWPLGLFDRCGVSDGCAATIIITPEIAKGLKKDYILVKGLRLTCGTRHPKAEL